LLAKSSDGSESFFRWHLGEPSGTATLLDNDLDILVAHWNKTGNEDLAAEVWMWDDPIGSTFLLPLPLEAARDRARLEKFFGSLWVWWEPDPPPDPPDDPLSPVRLPRRTAPIRISDSRTKGFLLELAPIPAEGSVWQWQVSGDGGFSTPRSGRYRPLVGLPYTIVKEVNPDEVKGARRGGINFLTFGVTALIGPIFADLIGKGFATYAKPCRPFRASGIFWMTGIALAILLSMFLRETGHARKSAEAV